MQDGVAFELQRGDQAVADRGRTAQDKKRIAFGKIQFVVGGLECSVDRRQRKPFDVVVLYIPICPILGRIR